MDNSTGEIYDYGGGMGLSEVFGMAILFVVLGIVIMMVELFRRDKQ